MAEEGKVYSNRKKQDPTVPLFLNDGHQLEIEEESCCSAHSTLVSDQNTTFTAVKLHGKVMTLKGTRIDSWPSNTEVACWYDTFSFSSVPIPLPHHYDQQKKAFVVYGNVCSVECGLAYMHRESRRHDLWERIVLFEDMMHKVFHIKTMGCEPAPPFLTLTRFGGFFSIEEFRASFNTVKMTVISPPFLMYPLVIQEKHNLQETTKEVIHDETVLSTGHVLRGLRRPQRAVNPVTSGNLAESTGVEAAASTRRTETPVADVDMTPVRPVKPAASAVRVTAPVVKTSGPLTVAALSDSSSDSEEGASVTVTPMPPPLSSIQLGKTTKGKGRGRARSRTPNHPASGHASVNTMLSNFLIKK